MLAPAGASRGPRSGRRNRLTIRERDPSLSRAHVWRTPRPHDAAPQARAFPPWDSHLVLQRMPLTPPLPSGVFVCVELIQAVMEDRSGTA